MKSRVIKYKNSMVALFENKYGICEFDARRMIREFDFNSLLKACNYMALHDDPEIWVDSIYNWANGKEELLQM